MNAVRTAKEERGFMPLFLLFGETLTHTVTTLIATSVITDQHSFLGKLISVVGSLAFISVRSARAFDRAKVEPNSKHEVKANAIAKIRKIERENAIYSHLGMQISKAYNDLSIAFNQSVCNAHAKNNKSGLTIKPVQRAALRKIENWAKKVPDYDILDYLKPELDFKSLHLSMNHKKKK